MLIKRLIGLIIIILLSVITANAQSQEPSPGPGVGSNPPQIQTSPKQQRTEYDKRGTDQSPFIIKTINPPKTQEEKDQERKEHKEKTAVDRSLVSYTGYLVVFTAVLACFTLVLAGIGYWQGRQLEHSVDSLITSERAHIFSKIKTNKKVTLGDKSIAAQLWLYNLGKTPAIIKEIAFRGHKSITPPSRNDLFESHPPLVSFIGRDEEMEDAHRFEVSESEWSDLVAISPRNLVAEKPSIKFYCFGYVRYTTMFNQEHYHSFCWEFYAPFSKFALSPDSELNYNA